MVIDLGRLLNVGVIAEGIETEEQLQLLREIGNPDGTGFPARSTRAGGRGPRAPDPSQQNGTQSSQRLIPAEQFHGFRTGAATPDGR